MQIGKETGAVCHACSNGQLILTCAVLSELQAQAELHDAGASAAEARIALSHVRRLRDDSRRTIPRAWSNEVAGQGEIRVVYDVENLRTKLQYGLFPKFRVLRNRKVHVPEAWTKDAIPAQIAQPFRIGGHRESRGIEIACRSIPVRQHERYPGNNVGPLDAPETRTSCGGDVDRSAALDRD